MSLAYLCVCSDPTVKQDLDAIATPQSDLDFPVTTDRRSVREFLDAPFAGAKIIFSTYQSARVVGEALRKGETFDLGIFDEAHKTAGREGRNYAFALEDSNLPIRKRLFLTATPRHYNPLRKDKEGDAQLVFSMDKPRVYGEQAFRLNASVNAGLYMSASLDDSSCVKTITEQEAERHFGKFAEMASAGESILVTHNGQPWVVLQPPRKGGIPSSVAQWPDYPAHWRQHFPGGPTSGPTATELLAQDKEDRF